MQVKREHGRITVTGNDPDEVRKATEQEASNYPEIAYGTVFNVSQQDRMYVGTVQYWSAD